MAEIRFYHLERQNLDQVLPMLVSKALQNGHRIVIQAANDQQVEHINGHLWTYDANSFIPHASAKDTSSDQQKTNQPVWITAQDENPNNADVLILTQNPENPSLDGYTLICDMIDGRNEQAVADARTRWKSYKDAAHNVTYWQQSPQGGWEKKA